MTAAATTGQPAQDGNEMNAYGDLATLVAKST
jgi:hypothetical protein